MMSKSRLCNVNDYEKSYVCYILLPMIFIKRIFIPHQSNKSVNFISYQYILHPLLTASNCFTDALHGHYCNYIGLYFLTTGFIDHTIYVFAYMYTVCPSLFIKRYGRLLIYEQIMSL